MLVPPRAHGNSEGDMVGMGWLDRLDVKAWIDYLVQKNANYKIVLFDTFDDKHYQKHNQKLHKQHF